ncbi:MAG: hypothetical protein R2754_11150 [Microthrixaceae bacterium]
MDAAAKMTSKGQITVPKVVRAALGINKATKWCFEWRGAREDRAAAGR